MFPSLPQSIVRFGYKFYLFSPFTSSAGLSVVKHEVAPIYSYPGQAELHQLVVIRGFVVRYRSTLS